MFIIDDLFSAHDVLAAINPSKSLKLYNAHTYPSKVLIVNKEVRPGRITMIIVREELGY